MTDLLVEQFIRFCYDNLDFSSQQTFPSYKSLPICIIDCVYSLRARYYDTTVPVVNRYANAFMNGDSFSDGDTLSDFIDNINRVGGSVRFSMDILKNQQNLSRRNKSEVCYELAVKLRDYLDINTLDDFKSYPKLELLELVIRSVKGMGDAGTSYLFMLAGDPNRCKPDVHIHRCISDACGTGVSNAECQVLFSKAVEKLRATYPDIMVRDLDNIIWRKYQINADK